MRTDSWKIFDKTGSELNSYADSFLNIEFITDAQNSTGAEAYAVTDPSTIISEVVVTNSGWKYDPDNTEAKLTYSFGTFDRILTISEVSINYIDVSIFDPDPTVSQGIGSVNIDLSTAFIYPSVIYTSAVFMDPISVELIETEHLSILEEPSTGIYIRPYDTSNNTLVFKFSDGDPEIRLFEVDQDSQNLIWTNELIFDTSLYVLNTPIIINIGFKSEEEGVFERKLRAYHRVGGEDFQIAEILVNSQSIGQDERFDTLSQNFGFPNPKNIPHLFKEADINEAMPDWELLNYKGKHLVLEYDQIMPYIGTYKALINAIKWLGYEDIKIKEWFRNVKDNTKLSLYVPYEAAERVKTILYFSPEERKNLKKLNQLSLIYYITRETGEVDEWGTPLTEEVYEYNINEILVKLKSLKDWLEKNIIGVNARIIDVTGEGVYFERFRNFIYATQDKGSRANYSQSLTPKTILMDPSSYTGGSELIRGEASIGLTLAEITENNLKSFNGIRVKDLFQYYWDPCRGAFDPADIPLMIDMDLGTTKTIYYLPGASCAIISGEGAIYDLDTSTAFDASTNPTYFLVDPSVYIVADTSTRIEWWDPSTISVGASIRFPYLYDLQWRLSVSKEKAGVVGSEFVTNPLFIYDNDIKFYNIWDSSSLFYDVSAKIDVTIEKGYLRDSDNDIWTTNLAYSIYPNLYIRMDASSVKTITYDASYAIIDGSGIFYAVDSSSVDVSTLFNESLNPVYFVVNGSTYIEADTSTKIESPLQNGYTLESSLGVLYHFSSQFSLQPDTNAMLMYAFDDNYKVPLLTIEEYKWIEAGGTPHTLEKRYILDILDGNISMQKYLREPAALFNDPSIFRNEEYYINFNYDTSLLEQEIKLNVVYNSPRAPLYLYDPSLYYDLGPAEALVIDNSIYRMHVNHIGAYNVEIFGWDGQNNLYRNYLREKYDVWTKFPTIWSYLDTSCGPRADLISCPSASLTEYDISILSYDNLYPIFDRQYPLQGLTLEQDGDDNYYIKVPSISYFIDLPDPGSIARFYNMTERVTNRDNSEFTVDEDYQSFNIGDYVNLVLFDKDQYYFIDEASGYIDSSIAYNIINIDGIHTKFVTDASTEIYLLNDTERITYDPCNNLIDKTLDIDISNYIFEENQLVSIIIKDVCINTAEGKSWASSFRVLDVSTINNPDTGYWHQLQGNIPTFAIADPSRYTITAKHAFSTFADFNIDVNKAQEIANNFHIYLDNTYYQQYYLDNTFVYINVLFDQEDVLDQWYDPSTDGYLVSGPFYPRTKSITIDISTLVILDSYYDPSNYMLNQKNIWTVTDNENDDILFRVHNKSVPYIFEEAGTYNVQIEAYDSYGNLKIQYFEGLIIVRDK